MGSGSKGRNEEGAFVPAEKRRGRAAASNASGRFETEKREAFDDEWDRREEEDAKPLKTEEFEDASRRIITYNQSPDIPFDRSINPYRGCEHGCIYCFARPTHSYLGLSPGLDFETKLFFKPEAAKLLERELRDPAYRPQVISIGTNTDPYQPIERTRLVMRQILTVLDAFSHPVSIVTKSALVTRDLDLLAGMAKRGLAHVALSVTTLDHRLARKMEPRASTPKRRLAAIQALAEAGVPVGVMVAPVIPALNDHEIEKILEAAADAGAKHAAFIFMRLPYEIKTLFREWLDENFSDRKERVIHHIRAMKGGRDNNPDFHERFKGHGPYAEAIRARFKAACRRLQLNRDVKPLDLGRFARPAAKGEQFDLFHKSVAGQQRLPLLHS
jgi:DNA repair photolyase